MDRDQQLTLDTFQYHRRALLKYLLLLPAICSLNCDSLALLGRKSVISYFELVGFWSLINVNNKDPKEFNIESSTLVLSKDGKFTIQTKMSDKLAGVEVSSSGTWKMADRNIIYKIADKPEARTAIDRTGDILTFNPDMMIAPDNKPAMTQYAKAR